MFIWMKAVNGLRAKWIWTHFLLVGAWVSGPTAVIIKKLDSNIGINYWIILTISLWIPVVPHMSSWRIRLYPDTSVVALSLSYLERAWLAFINLWLSKCTYKTWNLIVLLVVGGKNHHQTQEVSVPHVKDVNKIQTVCNCSQLQFKVQRVGQSMLLCISFEKWWLVLMNAYGKENYVSGKVCMH